MEKQTLLLFLHTFYKTSHIPLFLLNEKKEILHQTPDFVKLPIDFFQHEIIKVKEARKIFSHFTSHELYTGFTYSYEDICYVITGPVLYYIKKRTSDLSKFKIFKYGNIANPQELLRTLPQIELNNFPFIQMLYDLLHGEHLTREEYKQHFTPIAEGKFSNQLYQAIFTQREESTSAYSYIDEQNLMQCIKHGDRSGARIFAAKIARGRIGNMSGDVIRRSKYAIIASIAIITRAVIDVGVPVEQSYAMSDVYISKIDEEYDSRHLFDLYMDMIIDFCALVESNKNSNFPSWVRNCMEYIDQHSHTDITLDELGEYVSMAPSYISVQFKKIVGKSIKQYTNEKRIAEAKFLLRTTKMSIQEIAITLNFSTQSYFTKVFKEIEQVLPNEYRSMHQESA